MSFAAARREGATPARDALRALWIGAGEPAEALVMAHLEGDEPALPSSFAVGTAAQVGIAAAALAAAQLWQLRGGQRQRVVVAMRDAALECRSERYLRVDGRPMAEFRDRIAGVYRCGDGRWIRLHTNFPHHRDGILALLECTGERADVERALQRWSALDFEERAAGAGLPTAVSRSFAEWEAHEQAAAVAPLPLVGIERIGDAPPRSLPPGRGPLDAVRVLDLTRVIAGPVCTRVLAGHGADVLLVTAAHLPAIEPLVIDTGRGKLSCRIDLREPAGRDRLRALLREADVLVAAYRPGALDALGFGAADLVRLRPGLVCVSLSAWGQAGPWAGRRGYDSLVQMATGLDDAEAAAAGADQPKPLPAQILDHASGQLMAFGAMAALRRRAIEGGSWHVRVSLARTAHWLAALGRAAGGLAAPDPGFNDVRDRLEETASGFGRLTVVRPAARLSETPLQWRRPSVPLGTHAPAWPAGT